MEDKSLVVQDILNIIYNYSDIRELIADEYSHSKNEHIDVKKLRLDKADINRILQPNAYGDFFGENGKFILFFNSFNKPDLMKELDELKSELITAIKEKNIQDIDFLIIKHNDFLQDTLKSCLKDTRFF